MASNPNQHPHCRNASCQELTMASNPNQHPSSRRVLVRCISTPSTNDRANPNPNSRTHSLEGQLSVDAPPQNQNHNNNNRRPGEVVIQESNNESQFDEFTPIQERRGRRIDDRFPRDMYRRWDQGIKINVSYFEGRLKPEEFLDWVDRIDQFFKWKGLPEDKKDKIRSWDRMKEKLRGKFFSSHMLSKMFHHLRQNTKSVDKYTEEFYLLQTRNDLNENEEQSVACYAAGLREVIQFEVILHDLARVDEAHCCLALKVKSQIRRFSTRRGIDEQSALRRNSQENKSHIEEPLREEETGIHAEDADGDDEGQFLVIVS
ncbi:hypothetical protein Acr_00g0100050 [Actinidia rufa]|uniref:Retrotransposon gag domain-containing protein n=1 Tax=Actinidia rufa TaxID=165716 RepID=A0A7J0E006_9ERIC|nr:hypothetical protein Acr_00g0100050 [Actinidia rufa]